MAKKTKKKAPKRVAKKATKKKVAKKKVAKKVGKKKRTHQQIGRSARQKGDVGERKVKNILLKAFPDTDRNFQERGGEKDGADVYTNLGRLDIEVKHRVGTSIPMAIRGAKANCREGYWWAAVDWPTEGPQRGQRTITMDLDHFVALVKRERARGFVRGTQHRGVEYAEAFGDFEIAQGEKEPEYQP